MTENLPKSVWQPLLQGDLFTQAQLAIQEIAQALAALPAPMQDFSLADGTAGVALFYAYLAQTTQAEAQTALAMDWLAQTLDGVAAHPLPHSLYTGLAGIAWTLIHLQGRLLEPDPDLVDGAIDKALLADVQRSPWPQDYDLISGLVGIGVYMLERLPQPLAVTALEQIVDRLAELAVQRADGLTWWTDPRWLSADGRAQLPQGCYDVGVAHGVGGVIGLLSQICRVPTAHGDVIAKARLLLDGAVTWLLAQQLPPTAPSCFPTWVQIDGARPPSRLAWCYGDLGIAVILLRAARAIGQPVWEQRARQLAHTVAQRARQPEDVQDTGLCHGFASIGHLLNRLYQATGEPEFAEVAQLWFARLLAQRQPSQGLAGFQAIGPETRATPHWVAEPGLLTGVAGIGLALLAATSPIAPDWDQMMLLALPNV